MTSSFAFVCLISKLFHSTGNKREFTYVSGNPCDPNNPDSQEEEEPTRNRGGSEEDLDENVPQNYPKRPIAAVQRPRPTHAPTTARAPTTVFQNRYNHQSLASEEEDDDRQIQFAQIPKTSPRPAFVQSTPRPRVQVIDTTPEPSPVSYASPTPSYATPKTSINITPKPLYRIQNHALSFQQQAQPSPPPTTYRPQTVSIVTPAPAHATTPSFAHKQQGVTFASGSTRGAIDFDAEFKKFQHDNAGGFQPITQSPSSQATKSVKIPSKGAPSSNPIYQTQLVYNPSSGQYDSNLYQSIAQTDGEFQLNQRIQPYVQQYQQPQYQIPQQQAVYRPPQPQQVVPQQVYQRQQNEQQFANSQQLFAQQLQQQQSQLHRDRIEASKKVQSPAHRFQLQAEPSPILTGQLRAQPNQQFYYLQPQAQQSGGQIEAFLRGHNLEY